MGTAPVRSNQNQPLHNFSLSFLKWGQRNQSRVNQRCRRFSGGSGRDPPLPPLPFSVNRRSSSSAGLDYETDSDNGKGLCGSRSPRSRFQFSSCSSQKRQRKRVREDGGGGSGEGCGDEFEEEELMEKPWNLRPRRAIAAENGGLRGGSADVVESAAAHQNEIMPKSVRLRGSVEGQGFERKEKKNKFWISLSRDEIEEDVYALTGSRPARRPKKRPKTIQKQVDNCFPGLYLVGLSADSYRVHD